MTAAIASMAVTRASSGMPILRDKCSMWKLLPIQNRNSTIVGINNSTYWTDVIMVCYGTIAMHMFRLFCVQFPAISV